MRIKINGPITPERLAEALAAAITRLGADFGSFFNANLYVRVYNHDGEEIELYGTNGKPAALLLPLPPGMPMQPPVAPEVLERRHHQLEQRKGLERQEQIRRDHEEKLWRAQVEQRTRAKELAVKAYQESVQQFESLLAKHGEALIAQLNAVVANVWKTHQPSWPHGKNKGQTRAMPVFAWDAGIGKVLLYRSPEKNGSPRAIQSPVHYLYSHRTLQPYRRYDAWRIVSETIRRLLIELSMNEALG
jgi:hypothetical protein